MTIAVVVPTYRRPELLGACLAALAAQTRPPDELVVVVRAGDDDSRAVAERARVVVVHEPGVLAAMRAGVGATTADVVAFTDDDAEPAPDWLERLARVFEDASVGAAGGRDVIPGQIEPRREVVGRVTRWGKVVGDHHLGSGAARDVDVLKGVNMAVRADLLALPTAGLLRGDGAEPSFELLVCGAVRRRGFRVVYDPSIEVRHLGAERAGRDRRERPDAFSVAAAAHNFVVASAALERRRVRQLAYALLLGSRGSPGLGRAAVGLLRGEREVVRRLPASLAGSVAAARTLARLPKPLLVEAAELRRSAQVGVAA